MSETSVRVARSHFESQYAMLANTELSPRKAIKMNVFDSDIKPEIMFLTV